MSVTILLALAGWLVYHYLTSQRDIAQKRRETITNHLIETYKELNYFTQWILSGSEGTSFPSEVINRAIADIQLFGSLKQIKLARDFSEKAAGGDRTIVKELDYIIHDLRDSLRSELKLPKTKETIAFLHMTSISRDK